ncbi:MAG TPA: hypothetical protein VN081_01745 [Dongiaceae bacterium]|nr:hypothetical protein [Dongiaceae bacterium]
MDQTPDRTPEKTNIGISDVEHSGNKNLPDEMREAPLREFDAPLRSVVADDENPDRPIQPELPEGLTVQGFTTTGVEGVAPVQPISTAVEASKPEQSTQRPGGFKLWHKIVAAAAGVAIVGGAGVGIKNAVDNQNKANVPEPDNKATSQPETSPSTKIVTTPEHIYTVSELLIPDSLSAQDAAKTLLEDRMTDWANAGESDTFQHTWIKDGGGTTPIEPVTAEIAKTFTSALYVPDWEKNPTLRQQAEADQTINTGTLNGWLLTYKSGDPADKEPYRRTITVEQVSEVSSTDTTATLSIQAVEHTNASQNRAVQLDPNHHSIDGNKLIGQLELQKVDGSWKLANILWHN